MRYELHYRNGIKKFDTLFQVRKITQNLKQPYIVYGFVESKMHEHIEEYELFGDKGAAGMMKEVTRGVPLLTLVAKYHTTYYTLTKYINRFRSKHESIK